MMKVSDIYLFTAFEVYISCQAFVEVESIDFL